MLIASLICSAILLLMVSLFAAARQYGLAVGVSVLAILGAAGMCLPIGLPALAIQAVALAIAAGVWAARKGSAKSFAWTSCGLTLAAYLVVYLTFVRPDMQEMAKLRADYGFESMVMRIPAVRPLIDSTPLSQNATEFLAAIEPEVESRERTNRRPYSLQFLHANTISDFINSPGFGITRMYRPSRRSITGYEEEVVPIEHPGQRETSAEWTNINPTAKPGVPIGAPKVHFDAYLDFTHPNGFGLVNSREQVAGFQAHRFRNPPNGSAGWKLQTLDLVGLVMHDQPVAYVSEHLPRMDELKDAPTRTLDGFESAGLEMLRQGEEMYSRESGSTLRLFGAIRAAKQCTVCHGCERGQLLGAFSYTLKSE